MAKKKNTLNGIYTILNIERLTADGFINKSDILYTIKTDQAKAMFGFTAFFTENSGDDFIPFQDVTQEEVLQWSKDYYGSENLLLLEAKVLKMYNETLKENTDPVETNGFPDNWN